MKKILKLLIVIVCFSCTAQNKNSLVESFFNDIFILKNKTDKELYSEYIYFKPDKIDNKKMLFFKEGIKFLKKNNPQLSDLKNISFTVTQYEKSNINNLLPFEKEIRKDIYIVSIDDKVITYVLMKEHKIYAFNILQKGTDGPAYFISDFN